MKINQDGTVVFDSQAELDSEMQKVADSTASELYKAAELNKVAAPQFFRNLDITGDRAKKKWERTVKYFRALAERNFSEINTLVRSSYAEAENSFYKAAGGLSEGVNADGGFLVPVEFTDQLIMTLETYGAARRYSTVVPMSTLTKNLNALTQKVTAYWTDEGNAITPSKWGVGRPVLTAKKLGGITLWTSELLEDSIVSIIDNLVTLFAEAFYGQEDDQFYNGTGSPFTGILAAATVTKDTKIVGGGVTPADITYDNLQDCVRSLSPGQLGVPMGQATSGLNNAAWHMHRTVFAVCREIKDTLNRPIVTDPMGIQPATLLGFPVEMNEKLPAASSIGAATKFAIFGNLKPWCYFGDRRRVTTKILDQATIGSDNLGQQDEEALRVIERVAEVIAIPGNIACLKTQ